jgi:hypothetical protein
LVAAALKRNAEARERLKKGKPLRATEQELLEQRAWWRAGKPPFRQIIRDEQVAL